MRLTLACLVAAVPAVAWGVCTLGGASSLPAPVATPLHAYRAGFGAPTRLAVDASGHVYVADPGAREVIVRAPNGHVVSRVGQLGRPVSVAVGSDRIYVGDADTGRVTATRAPTTPAIRRAGARMPTPRPRVTTRTTARWPTFATPTAPAAGRP